MSSSFLYRDIPAFQKQVHRLGLAANYGLDEDGVRAAMSLGLNYFFYPQLGGKKLYKPLSEAIERGERDKLVIATGPTIGFFGGSVRRACDKMLQKLGTDYLDLMQLFWLGKTSAWTDSTIKELRACKASGKARAIGVSIHDRPRAGRLAKDSPIDAFMIRYNAAHPGAEKDIFPHCETRKPAIIAYTATSWRGLLKRPSGWSGPVPTAGDCYRFCLSSPHVDLVLCAPANPQQLEENLKALERGPFDPDEMAWMRSFGKAVSGKEILPLQ